MIEKRDQLPENVSEETTSNFIYCLVEIAYSDPDEREALKAITALFRYLKTGRDKNMRDRTNFSLRSERVYALQAVTHIDKKTET